MRAEELKPVPRSGLVLWTGTVRTASLKDRCAAAAACGYSALSLSPHDYRQARSSGLTDRALRAVIADAGLRVACLDPYTRWLPTWEPPSNCSPQVLDFLGTNETEFFRSAEAVGATAMTVLEPFGRRWPPDQGAQSLAAVCAKAAESGMRVNLEFIPFLGIPDLASAWEIVQLSEAPNAAIVLDTWHYFRGTPDDALLARIPGNRIGAVQISDARADPVRDLETDCLHHRLPAGEGVFPLARVLAILAGTDGLHDVGPEIFSGAFDRRPAAVNARAALHGLQPWQDALAPTTEQE